MKHVRLAVFLLLIVPASIRAQESRTIFEVDPGLTVAWDINRKVRLDFATGREKTEELSSARWKLSGGASFRLKPLRKTLLDLIDTDKDHQFVFGVVYEFSRTSEAGITFREHRVMLDGTFRYTLPAKVLLTNRARIELRWLQDDYHWRFRDRLLFERPMRTRKLRFTPFAGAEAVWDRRHTSWNLFKFTGGVQFPLIRRSTLDVLYERQHCVTCADQNTNIVGLTLNIYLRRKK